MKVATSARTNARSKPNDGPSLVEGVVSFSLRFRSISRLILVLAAATLAMPSRFLYTQDIRWSQTRSECTKLQCPALVVTVEEN